MKRMLFLTIALALGAAACGDGQEDSGAAVPSSIEAPVADVEETTTTTDAELPLGETGFPSGPSALDDPLSPEFPTALVDVTKIISGGPPPDGIPPIDAPEFRTVAEADEYLDDAEPVVVLDIDGDVRAYPAQVLIWHEIVNDVVGGVPVAITYCPLCNSAVSYRRSIDGFETTFGTSGRLFASAMVMYDRATESLWTHYDGRAVVGILTGQNLESIPSPLLAWSDFKAAYPGGQVLDRDATGFSRAYGQNPYEGYDDESNTPFLFRGALDDRAVAMQRVVGVAIDEGDRAWALDVVSAADGANATNTAIGDRALVILWKSGQASALDDALISEGAEVGSVGVFDPVVNGDLLTFGVATDGDFVDDQTGSTWSITGEATAGDLAGTHLDRIVHLDTFWFAWSTYRPGTDLVDAP